ncbi:alpha/beta hydrolase-fold protein [Simiduia litorea]|uniref:carboxylesterase family protein n=1 Tax=Simiduia litorea TaxID=1435348 RepID=UPI0036F3E1AE
MRGLIAVGAFTFALLALVGCGESSHNEPQLVRTNYVSALDKKSREYFVYLPAGYRAQSDKKWPVLMFLHGNGERGNGQDELDYVLKHGPLYEAWIQKRDLPFIIISPQLHMLGMEKVPYIANRSRAEIPQRLAQGVPKRPTRFDTPELMRAGKNITDLSDVSPLLPMGWEQVEIDLLSILGAVHKTYATDKRRTYISGISYGGFGTWYMASKHPTLFAAAVPVVGWGHPSLMAPIAKAKLPVWAFAGGRDSAVSKAFFYAGINQLESYKASDVRFTVHEDMGHDAWTRVYAGQDVYDWLLLQRR